MIAGMVRRDPRAALYQWSSLLTITFRFAKSHQIPSIDNNNEGHPLSPGQWGVTDETRMRSSAMGSEQKFSDAVMVVAGLAPPPIVSKRNISW
jgi:hypothetical protein